MRFGSTAKVLLKCKLKYYRISEWDMGRCCNEVGQAGVRAQEFGTTCYARFFLQNTVAQ